MSYLRGFLPPGAGVPWPDAPFEATDADLPARGTPPFGNHDRATEIVWRRLNARQIRSALGVSPGGGRFGVKHRARAARPSLRESASAGGPPSAGSAPWAR